MRPSPFLASEVAHLTEVIGDQCNGITYPPFPELERFCLVGRDEFLRAVAAHPNGTPSDAAVSAAINAAPD